MSKEGRGSKGERNGGKQEEKNERSDGKKIKDGGCKDEEKKRESEIKRKCQIEEERK